MVKLREMKKSVYIFAFACLVTASACKEKIEPVTEVSLSAEQTELIMTASDTYAVFNIISNGSWQVECTSAVPTLDKDSWLTGYTKYGVNNAPVEVEFTENKERDVTRTATFSVTAMDKSVTLTLTQRPVDFVAELAVENPEVQVDYNVKEVVFEVKANIPWSVFSDSDWVRKYTRTGNGDGTITVEFDYNPKTVAREASLTVNSEAGETVLKIIQGGGPAPETAAKDVTVAEFLAAPDGGSELYRLSGIIENMVSATYGSMRIKDATGSAYVYCLLPEKDGQEATFGKLGLGVGDYIVMVGHKQISTVGGLRADELVDGYHESHKTVGRLSIEEYNRLPDGKINWYRLKGKVTSISDNVNGTFVLDDGTGTVEVTSLLSGVNGESGKFSESGIETGSEITVIAAEKSGGDVVLAYYEDSEAPALEPGIMARWNFTEAAAEETGFDMTWTGNRIVAGETDAVEYDNGAGDGGRYIDAYEGNGRMTFVQGDKTALDPDGDIVRRIVYYSGQPGAHGLAVDDYFLFTADAGMTIPAGAKFRFSFCLRPESAAAGYYTVEYLDGDSWKPVAGLAMASIGEYGYNLYREPSEQTLSICNIVTGQDMETLAIRIRVSAPYLANGNESGGIAKGGTRFRGTVGGEDLSPVIEIL